MESKNDPSLKHGFFKNCFSIKFNFGWVPELRFFWVQNRYKFVSDCSFRARWLLKFFFFVLCAVLDALGAKKTLLRAAQERLRAKKGSKMGPQNFSCSPLFTVPSRGPNWGPHFSSSGAIWEPFWSQCWAILGRCCCCVFAVVVALPVAVPSCCWDLFGTLPC